MCPTISSCSSIWPLTTTRFGGNPPHQNTFPDIESVPGAGNYLNGKDIYKSVNLSEIYRKARKKEKEDKLERIKNAEKKHLDENEFKDLINGTKENISDFYRSKRQLKYELVNKERNEILE